MILWTEVNENERGVNIYECHVNAYARICKTDLDTLVRQEEVARQSSSTSSANEVLLILKRSTTDIAEK